MSDNITYHHGGVAEFASDVGARSAALMEIHDDVTQRTNAIADFFQGAAERAPTSEANSATPPWW